MGDRMLPRSLCAEYRPKRGLRYLAMSIPAIHCEGALGGLVPYRGRQAKQ